MQPLSSQTEMPVRFSNTSRAAADLIQQAYRYRPRQRPRRAAARANAQDRARHRRAGTRARAIERAAQRCRPAVLLERYAPCPGRSVVLRGQTDAADPGDGFAPGDSVEAIGRDGGPAIFGSVVAVDPDGVVVELTGFPTPFRRPRTDSCACASTTTSAPFACEPSSASCASGTSWTGWGRY